MFRSSVGLLESVFELPSVWGRLNS